MRILRARLFGTGVMLAGILVALSGCGHPSTHSATSSSTSAHQSVATASQRPVVPNRFGDLLFLSQKTGWASAVVGGAGILETTVDGGGQWNTVLTVPDMTGSGIAFPTSSVGYAAFHSWQSGANARAPEIWHTSNGGAQWQKVSLPEQSGRSNYCDTALTLDFTNASTGWALCLQADGVNQLKTLYATTDSGTTWSIVAVAGTGQGSLPLVGAANGLRFSNSQDGWIGLTANCPSQVLKTVDGGRTWLSVSIAGQNAAPGTLCATSAPVFSAGEGLVAVSVGASGRLYGMAQDQRGWRVLRTLPTGMARAWVQSYDVVWGLESASNSTVLSVDQGKQWSPLSLPKGVAFTNGVDIVSPDDVWAVGTAQTSSVLLHGTQAASKWTWRSTALPVLLITTTGIQADRDS